MFFKGYLLMQYRFLFADKKFLNREKRERRAGNLWRCCLALVVILCSLLLTGCACPKCACPPTVVDETAITVGGSAESPVAQGIPTEPFWPLAPPGAARQSQNVSHGAIMTFEKTVHDFGQVGPRSKNVCEFRFKNTGTNTLTVQRRIGSTCGCTATMLTQTDYAPGEEGAIQVTYTASSIPTTARKTLTVHSNDPKNPQVRLTIAAKIATQIAYEPKQLDLLLKDNAATCPPITLRSLDGTAFSVAGVLCTGNSMSAEIDSSVRATEFTIQPTVDVEKLQKLPTGYIALSLTHPECKLVTIRYKTRSGFQFVPALPMFFNAEPNIPTQKVVHLSNDYGEDFEIASFSSERNLVDVSKMTKLAPDGKGQIRYRLMVSMTPPMRTGEEKIFTDTLSIHLTNGQTLELDCRGIYTIPQAAAGPYPPP